MSVINFGATVSMTTAATPSQGWIIGYDLDGFLKQKDTSGNIVQIGVGGTAGISATPSLTDVVKIGNSLGTYSIIMGSYSSILSSDGNSQIQFDSDFDKITLSTDDGVAYSGASIVSPNLIRLLTADLSSSTASKVDLTSFNLISRVGDSQVYLLQDITPNSYTLTLNNTTLLSGQIDIIKSGSTYDFGSLNKSSLHLNTINSVTLNGIANSVIIGGGGMVSSENNTVYVPQLVIQNGQRVKAGAGYGLLEFNQYNDVILSTDMPVISNSIIGIFSSTSSSIHLSGKNGILVRDTYTSSSTPTSQSAVTSISSQGSYIESGIYNSVIVGGSGLFATESNVVYLGNKVNINNAYSLPTVDGSNSEVLLTDGSGQTYWGPVPASSSPTLNQVLSQGIDSWSNNIMMGTGTSIISGNGGGSIYLDEGFTSGNVVISSNNGSLSDTYIDMTTTDLTLYSPSTFNLNFNSSSVISGNSEGIKYAFDYSASFVTYSLVDKNYVDSNFLSQVDNTSIELNGNGEVSLKSTISGNRQFTDSVSILGDFTVLGTTSTIYTENLVVEDNFITLNGTYSGPAIDTGIEVNLGDGTYSKIFWSSAYQSWIAGASGSEMVIVNDAMNGLSQAGNKLGLGGILSQNTQIYGQGYDLSIIGLNSLTITASSFINNSVQNLSGTLRTEVISPDGATFSRLRIDGSRAAFQSFGYSGQTIISNFNQVQSIGDGSTNNRIIVSDSLAKGIVYEGDYTANFTTYSLVTKGYVDSLSNVQGENGLTQSISGNIGLGGTLTKPVFIEGDLKNLYINNLGRLVFTSSVFIDNRVYNNLNESRIYTYGTAIDMKVTYDSSTYSRVFVDNQSTTIIAFDGAASTNILVTNIDQSINDGSSDNRLLVTDVNQKGLVYTDDYTANFSTYSLVTKGYVDNSLYNYISGSGKSSYLSKWSSVKGLTNSIIYDGGNYISIGSTTSGYKLAVQSSDIDTALYVRNNSIALYDRIGLEIDIEGQNSTNNIGSLIQVQDSGTASVNTGISVYLSSSNGSTNTTNTGISIDLTTTGNSNVGLGIQCYGSTTNTALITYEGSSIFNQHGNANSDFNIKGNLDTDLFYAVASTDSIGIGTSTPTNKLEVVGTVSSTTGFNVNGLNGWSGTFSVLEGIVTVTGGIITSLV